MQPWVQSHGQGLGVGISADTLQNVFIYVTISQVHKIYGGMLKHVCNQVFPLFLLHSVFSFFYLEVL